MSDRYPGGLIRKTPPTITPPVDGEGGSAPGIWTLEQASYYQGTGEWPKPVAPKSIYGWGTASYGELDSNRDPAIFISSPVQVTDKTNWASITTQNSGYSEFFFVHAINQAGELWGWGKNLLGQVGDGTAISRSSPVQIGALTNWSIVASSYDTGLAIKTDGTLWGWGRGTQGNIGNGAYTNKNSPVQVGTETDWIKINGGTKHVLGIRGTAGGPGALYSWGINTKGQLGLGNTTSTNSPNQVGALTTWLEAVGGYYGSFAIKNDGTLWVWGANTQGVNGRSEPSATQYNSPVQVGSLTTWLKGTSSYGTAAFIKTDGTLWTWGRGNNYTTGHGDTTNRSSPVQVGSETWSEVTLGNQAMGAIKTDGSLWTCGSNSSGATGQNVGSGFTTTLTQVGAENTWLSLAVGGYQRIIALKK
jgi:alpha-tubulin suppressor-like RCC1 family protein